MKKERNEKNVMWKKDDESQITEWKEKKRCIKN